MSTVTLSQPWWLMLSAASMLGSPSQMFVACFPPAQISRKRLARIVPSHRF
jgi:hypothetical protein